MSLVNQMLRDLQQRQKGQSAAPPAAPAKRSRHPRRRFSIAKLVGTVPPVFWVGVGGVAGVVLIWGFFGWLSGGLGPGSTGPVPTPPADMVAIANAPRPVATEISPAAKRRAPPVPIDVPPPAPPLAYGSTEPAGAGLPVAVSSPATPSPPAAAPARTPPTVFSDRPLLLSPPAALARPAAPAAVARKSEAGPVPAASGVVHLPGVAVNPPGRLHPDLLPGAVNATNLALQKAAREAAAVPPVVTPYGQAEVAYREGRAAYEANRPETSLAALRRALAHYPGHLQARELLADQLEMAGQADEALTQLKQGLAIAPDYTPFRKRAARILLDRGDAIGATGVLIGNGLPRVEDDPELHLLLAGIYLRLGENFLAAQTFRNLLVHDPQAGQLWVGLGDALAADGQPAEARKSYRKALAVGGMSRETAAQVQAKLVQR